MTKDQAVLTVDFRKEYSSNMDGVVASNRVCLSLNAIHGGLIKEVGANRLAILLAIVSYMDEHGQCFPSQEKIAELTGQGRATIQRNLQELCEVEFNGQKLLHRELIGNKRKKTVYTINASAITNTNLTGETITKDVIVEPSLKIEQDKPKEMNAKDFVTFFAQQFAQHFGEGHSPNFAREGAVFKKLLTSYSADTLKLIIETVMKHYKEKWYKPQYPHPTVFQLGSWLADDAYKIVKAEQDQAQQLEQRIVKAQEQDDTDRALDLFDL